jgi:hypothetical protein
MVQFRKAMDKYGFIICIAEPGSECEQMLANATEYAEKEVIANEQIKPLSIFQKISPNYTTKDLFESRNAGRIMKPVPDDENPVMNVLNPLVKLLGHPFVLSGDDSVMAILLVSCSFYYVILNII